MNLVVIPAPAPHVKFTSIYCGIIPFQVAPPIVRVLLFPFPRSRYGCQGRRMAERTARASMNRFIFACG